MTTDAIEHEHSGAWLESIGNRWGPIAATDDAAPSITATADGAVSGAPKTVGAEDAEQRVLAQLAQLESDLDAADISPTVREYHERVRGERGWYAKHDHLAALAADRYAWADHLAAGNEADAAIWAEMVRHKQSLNLPATADSLAIRDRIAELDRQTAAQAKAATSKNAKPARPAAVPTDPLELSRQFQEAVLNDDRTTINRLSAAMEKAGVLNRGGYTEAEDGSFTGWFS